MYSGREKNGPTAGKSGSGKFDIDSEPHDS